MQQNPFPLFEQFADDLTVTMFTKEDDTPNEDKVARLLNVTAGAGLQQVHGNETIVVRGSMKRTMKADGMITDQTELALTVRSADCQSFVIFAPERRVVGVLHAGWRGLVENALGGFYDVLRDEWEIDPAETYVGAGPSLCSRCAEFSDPRRELPSIDPIFFDGRLVDLRGIATNQFIELGVPSSQIQRHADCTVCMPETYFTYRGGDKNAVISGSCNVLACAMPKK